MLFSNPTVTMIERREIVMKNQIQHRSGADLDRRADRANMIDPKAPKRTLRKLYTEVIAAQRAYRIAIAGARRAA
jgi:hypothetical protein